MRSAAIEPSPAFPEALSKSSRAPNPVFALAALDTVSVVVALTLDALTCSALEGVVVPMPTFPFVNRVT